VGTKHYPSVDFPRSNNSPFFLILANSTTTTNNTTMVSHLLLWWHEFNTLASRGLEELFPVVLLCCVSFWFWREMQDIIFRRIVLGSSGK
jgi:hypothetical protein